jgi:hypothetical protein
MPGKMAYLGYTSDDGNVYSLKTRARYLGALDQTVGGSVMLGFDAFDGALPPLPPGMKPRGVYVKDQSGGASRFLPVGKVTALAWTGPNHTVQIDYSGIGTMTDAEIQGRRSEHPARKPHVIVNVSDAS